MSTLMSNKCPIHHVEAFIKDCCVSPDLPFNDRQRAMRNDFSYIRGMLVHVPTMQAEYPDVEAALNSRKGKKSARVGGMKKAAALSDWVRGRAELARRTLVARRAGLEGCRRRAASSLACAEAVRLAAGAAGKFGA